MTQNKRAKKAARDLKAVEGISYTAARRQATPPDPWDDIPEFPRLTLNEIITRSLQHTCDQKIGDTVDSLNDVVVRVIDNLVDATIGDLQVRTETADVQVVEEYDGSTVVCNVTVMADVSFEGLMSKGDATMWEAAGQVEMIDFDFNDHYALVAVKPTQEIEVVFDAIATPDAESLEDLVLAGASG